MPDDDRNDEAARHRRGILTAYVHALAFSALMTGLGHRLLRWVTVNGYGADYAAHAREADRLTRFFALAVACAFVAGRLRLRDKAPMMGAALAQLTAAAVTLTGTVMAVGLAARLPGLWLAGLLAANAVLAFGIMRRVMHAAGPAAYFGLAIAQMLFLHWAIT